MSQNVEYLPPSRHTMSHFVDPLRPPNVWRNLWMPPQWFTSRSTAQTKQQKKCRKPTTEIISDFKLQLSTAQVRRQKKLQHLTRPVENVALTTKGLQETKTHLLNGTTVKKVIKNKFILTEIFSSVHETWYLKVEPWRRTLYFNFFWYKIFLYWF